MKLKSLFFNEEIPKPIVAAPSVPNVTASMSPTPATPFAPTYKSNVTLVDPEMRAVLLESLQNNKLAGFDYLKFVAALEEMKEFGGTEESRLKMAFITAKQLGVDKVKLTESAKHYLGVLERDASEFNAQLIDKQTQTVGANEKRLEEIEKTIETHHKTLVSLNEEIGKLQLERNTLTAKVTEDRIKLETKKASFENTYTSLTSEIQANIQKINQCI